MTAVDVLCLKNSFEAIAHQNLEITRILTTNGANINFIDSGGWTPLAEAVCVKNMEIVRFLVENGLMSTFIMEMVELPFMKLSYKNTRKCSITF